MLDATHASLPRSHRSPSLSPHLEVRRVSDTGSFRPHSRSALRLSGSQRREHIDLEDVEDGAAVVLRFEAFQ
jgi:hypothetical protein